VLVKEFTRNFSELDTYKRLGGVYPMKNGKLLLIILILCIFLLSSLASTSVRAKNNVSAENSGTGSGKMRVQLLEKALEPHAPLTAAKAWAEAVKARNGAWQYALLSPELKKEYYDGFT